MMVATVAAVACASIAFGASSATAPKAAAATTPPAVTTGSATSTGPSSETVSGIVNPYGQATNYYFQYGLSSNYGLHTAETSAGAGSVDVPVSANLTGLDPTTTYHYRLVAVRSGFIAYGADQAFAAGATTSQIRVMGREGFVSPGGVIGVEVGCFDGQTTCAGHIEMTHDGSIVGQRNFSIPPESGGFQNLGLTARGQQLLRDNRVFDLLAVNVTVNDTDGQTLTYVIHLARWVWH
jgi:hypothetical protein